MSETTNTQRKRVDPLLIAAFGLLVVAVAVLWQWPPGVAREYRDLTAALVGSAGVALLLASLIEKKHLDIALGRNADRIVERGTTELDLAFRKSFAILDQANMNGLLAIYAPRQAAHDASTLQSAIQTEIRRTQRLDIIGISGLDFFSYPRGAGTQAGAYYDSCKARLEGRSEQTSSPLQVRVLFLDPKSPAAQLREKIETIEDERPRISMDIETAKKGIDNLNRSKKRGEVQYAFYNTCPQVWAVLTDDSVFVEPYHLAPTVELCEALRFAGLKASQIDVNCTGGRVPVFRFTKHSNMYCAMKLHFECLWNESKNQGKETGRVACEQRSAGDGCTRA